MIDRVAGVLLEVQGTAAIAAIVDLHGLGLRVEVSATTARHLPAPGEPVALLAHLHVHGGQGEPTLRMFGFATPEERAMFRLLTGVSGIGPSHALAILSAFPPAEVAAAIARGDEEAVKVKGIGPRLAKRVVSELKDKVLGAGVLTPLTASQAARRPALQTGQASALQEALRALRALELEPEEARRILLEVQQELPPTATADELVRAALLRA